MRHDNDDNTTQDDTVAVPIAGWMAVGLHVYDADGARIGEVRRYDLEAGYMLVEEGALTKRELYVPFHLMRSITPHEIYLSLSKNALTDAYLLPPAAKPLVEQQIDADTGRTDAVILHEIHSGYDGHPVEVEPVRVDELTHTLAIGMTVMDVDEEYVGEVTQVDTAGWRLTVRGRMTGDVMRAIPFSAVAHVDPDTGIVTLLVPAIALQTER